MYGASGFRCPLTRKRHNPRILSLVVPLSFILRHGFGGSAGIVASSSPLDCAVSRSALTLPCGALDVGSSAACVIARALYGIASGDADADAIGTVDAVVPFLSERLPGLSMLVPRLLACLQGHCGNQLPLSIVNGEVSRI